MSLISIYITTYKVSNILNRKITCFLNLISKFPFDFLHIPYDFHTDFQLLLKIYFLYDLDDVAHELIDMFNLVSIDYVLNRAYIPMQLQLKSDVSEILYEYEKMHQGKVADLFCH